jgi:hypothetical protein
MKEMLVKAGWEKASTRAVSIEECILAARHSSGDGWILERGNTEQEEQT